jgi:lysophospholipase L1-like esterase
MKPPFSFCRMRALLPASVALNLILFALCAYLLRAHGWHALGFFVHSANSSHPVSLEHTVRGSLFDVFATEPARASLVFIGDSLTQYCEWNELLGRPALNRGIAGDTTADILARMNAIAALHPNQVFLMAGTNDALQQVKFETFSTNYANIIHRIQQSNSEAIVYVESIPPMLPNGSGVRLIGKEHAVSINEVIRTMNERIRSFADGRSVIYVDLYADLQKNGELNPDYTVDGCHLNFRSYQVWKERIAPFTPGNSQELPGRAVPLLNSPGGTNEASK